MQINTKKVVQKLIFIVQTCQKDRDGEVLPAILYDN